MAKNLPDSKGLCLPPERQQEKDKPIFSRQGVPEPGGVCRKGASFALLSDGPLTVVGLGEGPLQFI